MAQAQHFDLKHTFNPANVAFSNKEGMLAQEAFPGELASLRTELARLSQVKQNQKKLTKPLASAKVLSASQVQLQPPLQREQLNQSSQTTQTQMADQLIEMMPTGLVMLDGNGVVVKINKVARNLLDEPILGQLWFTNTDH